MSDAPHQPLRHRTMSGVVNAATATLVQLASQLLGLAVLARLLTPADFGVTAPSLAIANVLTLIAEFGLGANLIQRPKLADEDIGAALAFALGAAIILSVVALTFIAPICRLIDLSRPEVLAGSLAITLVGPSATILESLCLKRFRFRAVLVASVVASLIGNLLVPVAMALAGAGLWSIIAAQLVMPLVKVIVLIVREPTLRIRPSFSVPAIRRLLHFSSYFTGAKILNMVSLQGDRVMLAHAVSADALGLYSRAQNFSQLVITLLTSAFEKALFPLLASIQHDPLRTRRIYLEVFFVISALTGLAAVAAASISYTLIVLLLGPKWGGAAAIAAVFSATIFLRCTDRLAAILLRSNAMLKERTILQAFFAIGTLISCWLFADVSLTAVAMAIVAFNAVGFVYTQFIVARFLRIPLRTLIGSFARGALIAGIYAVLYAALDRIPLSIAIEPRQIAQASIAMSITIAIVLAFRRRLLSLAAIDLLTNIMAAFRLKARGTT